MFYSLARFLVEVIATSHGSEAELRAEVLALRRQVQVLERQIKRVRWEPGDRLILAALRERLLRQPGLGCWCGQRPCLAGIVSWCAGDGPHIHGVRESAAHRSRRRFGS